MSESFQYVSEFKDVRTVARDDIPDSISTVLLGESSHGTQEFYQLRADITKYLVEVKKFKVIMVEADWPFMWHINQYIHRKKLKMFPDGVRFPDWMWKNKPFQDLIEWMRRQSQTDNPCYLFGMDCYCKEESCQDLLRFLDAHDPDLGRELRQTCYPRERAEKWPAILSKIQWGRSQTTKRSSAGSQSGHVRDNIYRGCSKLDRFNAEQNLECMIAADEYYTKQRLEPPGSQASWNARDQHMATTLIRLKEHGEELFGVKDELKVIVWAHNSHVGDSTATPSGGVNFERNETWNLGQMAKSILQNVFIIGFYTYDGEVRAAHEWGQPGQVMKLQKALPCSFEGMLHGLGENKKLVVRLPKTSPGRSSSSKSKKEQQPSTESLLAYNPGDYPLNCEYRALHGSIVVTSGPDEKSSKVPNFDHNKAFIAVERKQIVTKYGSVIRLRSDQGYWITEYTPSRSVSIHCRPMQYLQKIASVDSIVYGNSLGNIPMIQRWVGVQYHPKTEFESHYGELLPSRAYDLVLFVDKTQALNVDISSGKDEKGSGGADTVPPNRRLLKEYTRLLKTPIENIIAHPMENNILEWHFVLVGRQEPYSNGVYHGLLEFPEDFPMKPPSIKMLTPNGRFEINKRICLSMSDFHKESWNPSWTVEKILLGLLSFMYEDSVESVGSILDSYENRKIFAQDSQYFNRQNEIYCSLFLREDGSLNLSEVSNKKSRPSSSTNNDPSASGSMEVGEKGDKKRKLNDQNQQQDDDDTVPVCRYCLTPGSPGHELVNPCECKGSTKWVHELCLRQWQKSVLLTQSTHPKYQTRIDAICNICQKPFKGEYKPKDRTSAVLEFTGKDIVQHMKKGNLLVSSEKDSKNSAEAMEKHPEIVPQLCHWTYAVFLIVNDVTYSFSGNGKKERDAGVMAVNLVMNVDQPPKSVSGSLPGDRYNRSVSPYNNWIGHYKGQIEKMAFISNITHAIGGPVEPDEPLGLTELPQYAQVFFGGQTDPTGNTTSGSGSSSSSSLSINESSSKELRIAKALHVRNGLFFGDLGALLTIMKKHAEATNIRIPLRIFWGYAAWNCTQLLAEVARRNWGFSPKAISLASPTLKWDNYYEDMYMAKESEYSKNDEE